MAQQLINVGTSANDGTGDSLRNGGIKVNENFTEVYSKFLDNRVIVRQASDFGVIDSSKQYFIDGFIDMGTTEIEVPATGIFIQGYGLGVSKLFSTEDNYTMFTSPVGGSGNLLFNDFTIDVSGSNSSVFALDDATGFNATEFNIVNFENCTSRGFLDGYRQGLETGVGIFGGTPELEFRGTWLGGYKISNSIVRSVTDTTFSLYKCAVGQTFASRFGGDPNVELPANVSFLECTESNFVNDNTLQISDAIFSGMGTVLNGITQVNSKVRISNTSGVLNTYVGGFWSCTAEATTVISSTNTFVKLAGTTTYAGLTWFDNTTDNAITSNTTESISVKTTFVGSFTGNNNRAYALRFRVWDDSESAYVDYAETVFTANGGILSDRAESVVLISPQIILNENDRIEVWIANTTDSNNVTMLLNSRLIIEEAKS